MLIRPAIGDTDPIRYRRPTPDGQFSGNIIDEAMRGQYCKPNDMPAGDFREFHLIRGKFGQPEIFPNARKAAGCGPFSPNRAT
jgi:hypothetical protein